MIPPKTASIILAKTTLKLVTEKDNSFISLRNKAKEYIMTFVQDLNLSISEDELAKMSFDAIGKLSLSPDIGISVESSRIKEDKWLEKSDVSFDYFKRFEKYLQVRKKWPNTEALNKDSYAIIQMLGCPLKGCNNHRRGLLIGDVQSGKTASYTAILNRAVDVGYDVIVLLAGSLENLRRQTQERIDKELVGFTLDPEDNKSMISVGVGDYYKIDNHLRVQTTTKKDFTSRTRETIESKIQKDTLLYITKKNVNTLEEIYNAILSDNSDIIDENGKVDASILIIDDEADNATVNTKKHSNLDPTKINGGIRKLLTIFRKTSYLAVTATPFANIYIDDTTENEMFGDDLFPSDFIHLLSRPTGYASAYKLFGDYIADPDDPISFKSCNIAIDSKEIPDNSYRFRHKKDEVVVGSFKDFPEGLQESIRYFLLVQYLMDFLPKVEKPHRTMMINVSRFVSVQNAFAIAIKLWMEETLLPQVLQWHNYPDAALQQNSGEFYKLKKVWDKFSLGCVSEKTWEEICPGLYDSLSSVRVCSENMSRVAREMGRLNYEAYPEGDRVIAVGGQCLSRGLTLENLVVTYFYRNSAAYDTLLQMGRWFGYRNAYLKYFKLWMAEESITWYRLISEACEDLRSQIDKMNDLGMEPRQFGLMVRRHPYSGLIITARSKMRNSRRDFRQPVDLHGRLIESPRLWIEDDLNTKNSDLINAFLVSTNSFSYDEGGNILISNVPKSDIYPLIYSFESAELSIGFKVNQLGDYILKNLDQDWDVVIPGNGDGPQLTLSIGEQSILLRTVKRKFKHDCSNQDGRPFVRINDHHVRIGQGDITKMGLSASQLSELESRYNSEQHEKKWREVKSSYAIYLQAYKENSNVYRNPLLILYPLTLEDLDKENPFVFNSSVVWGIGIGFPGVRGANEDRYFEYWLNPVAMRQNNGIEEEEDDEDETVTE